MKNNGHIYTAHKCISFRKDGPQQVPLYLLSSLRQINKYVCVLLFWPLLMWFNTCLNFLMFRASELAPLNCPFQGGTVFILTETATIRTNRKLLNHATPGRLFLRLASIFQTRPEPGVHCELLVFGAGADTAGEQRPRHAQRHLQQQRHCPPGARGRGCHQALQKGQSWNWGGRGHAKPRGVTPRQEIYVKICSLTPQGRRQASRSRPRPDKRQLWWSSCLQPQIFSHLLLLLLVLLPPRRLYSAGNHQGRRTAEAAKVFALCSQVTVQIVV